MYNTAYAYSYFDTFDLSVIVILTFGKPQINLVFNSLNRTLDLKVQGTSARKYKKKKVFFFCTSLTYSYL